MADEQDEQMKRWVLSGLRFPDGSRMDVNGAEDLERIVDESERRPADGQPEADPKSQLERDQAEAASLVPKVRGYLNKFIERAEREGQVA